jgi:SAM-dependent methyltransferase
MSQYHLALSDIERDRYRRMAGYAAEDEQLDLAAAVIGPGARVADVGCGPGAVTSVLADLVAPDGQVDGVDADEGAVACAVEELGGRAGTTVRVGRAEATGLEPGAYDVAMCRHVLAHNGGLEQRIVDHLRSLVRPGGAVYLVDADLTGISVIPSDPDLVLHQRYPDFHAAKGNDPQVGLRLGDLLETAGCTVERFHGIGRVTRLPAGMRPPAWAAREAMVASGIVTDDDVARTGAALDRIETSGTRPWLALTSYLAVGRVP